MKAEAARRNWLGGLVALVLAVLGIGDVAHGQMGMGGDPTAFMSPINRRSIDEYAQILGLDPEQKDAIRSLYDGYVVSHGELREEIRRAFEAAQEKFQETQDIKAYQRDLPKAMKEISDRIERLEKSFLDDARSLLSVEQQEKWGRVERHRRRENGLRFGMVSGQAVDLLKVVQTLKIDPARVPELAEQLDRYEQDMDRALVAGEKFQKEQQARAEEFQDFDFSKMQEIMEKATEMAKKGLEYARAIRDVNRQFARTIQPALPEDLRARFEAEYSRRVFPRVYGESYLTKAIAAARGFADLTDDQKATLGEIGESYQRELEAANRRWAAAIEEREEKTGGPMMEMMGMWTGGGNGAANAEGVNKARADRKELDKRTKAKLLALLGEEQRKRLPEEKKEAASQGWGGMEFFVQPDADGE